MKHILSPDMSDLQSESVLFQAWKKTAAFVRSHNWYADTLELDWQALRLPDFLGEIRQRLQTVNWTTEPLRMVPAPKSQSWEVTNSDWQPAKGKEKKRPRAKIRPLAHVELADQVVCTAVMLCLADRVETIQGEPTRSAKTADDRKRLLSYGHRLFCDHDEQTGNLRHRWGSQKLYRVYSTDYQRFLARPDAVADAVHPPNGFETTIVNADLSRFYDRVRPELLAQRIARLRHGTEEEAFFTFASKLFDWRWHDARRASSYSKEAKVERFDRIALPQGLVASGFFSNVVLLPFDERLSQSFGNRIIADESTVLVDACRYVDDLRLVLHVPVGAKEEEIEVSVTKWLNDQLDSPQTHLIVERKKTKAVVRNRQARFSVPQSRTASRIQHELSGGFDVEQGVQLISAIEGFFHAQRHYSTDAEEPQPGFPTILRGISDMRDDTAARFAAGRFRRTFRSLRPLLESEALALGQQWEIDDDNAPPRIQFLISREQLDERAHIFANGLLEAWEGNPSQVRLLRIAVDMFPRKDFIERILSRLRPSWQIGNVRGERREVMAYCLAEIFRAGATETGIVTDEEVLPSSSDIEGYHDTLLAEAKLILETACAATSSPQRFPWYLLQQVLLYLAVRQATPASASQLSKLPGRANILRRYWSLCNFLSNDLAASVKDRARFHILIARCIGADQSTTSFLAANCEPRLLEAFADISPAFAESIWESVNVDRKHQLDAIATKLRLVKSRGSLSTDKVCVADVVTETVNIWHEEANLVVLASELLKARQKRPEGVLTPWRVYCALDEVNLGPVKNRVHRGTVSIESAVGGEQYFAPPDWCDSEDEKIRVEVGQVLRFLLTGSVEYLRPVLRTRASSSMPRYRPAISHWEQGRYGSFNGRAAFGPDWLPISTWVESLLVELLRWPGCGSLDSTLTVRQLRATLVERRRELLRQRGKATGTLFLEQEAPWPDKPPTEWQRPLRIGIVQSVVPSDDDFTTTDLQLNDNAIRRKHRLHLRTVLQGVRQMLRVRLTHPHGAGPRRPNVDWLIMPELAVHTDDVDSLLLPIVRDFRCIMLVGLVYHPRDARPNAPLINSALWLIPEWSRAHGLQIRRVEQGKAHLAPAEEKEFGALVTPFRPTQWIIRYRWHSNPARPPLLLSASICYDATDTALAADLRDRNDLYAVCALNTDVATFDNLAESLNYHIFQGVLVVNNGTYGGSSFFAPLKKDFRREILHFHGQPQAHIGFAEIEPIKVIGRPSGTPDDRPQGEWKNPPAGWHGPHSQ